MTTNPSPDDRVAPIADLLRHAAKAHHRAFLATNGFDPEWPLWYAAHLHGALGPLLDHEFTESELVYHLVRIDRRHRAIRSDRDWPEVYAEYFLHAEL